MSKNWSLEALFADFHKEIQSELTTARKLGHQTEKGDASELVWIDVFNKYLPRRYEARKGFVVDSTGRFSEQIDVILHDRQYSPFVFTFKGTDVVPSESVYAVFEAKQEVSSANIRYASEKASSVRCLYRTSLSAETIDGPSRPKPLHHILAGILALDSNWNPSLGSTLISNLDSTRGDGILDIGCIANAGWFMQKNEKYETYSDEKSATKFMFELIAQLQAIGTAPMMDVRAYARMI